MLLLADLSGWPVSGGAPVSLCRDLQEAATHASAALEWFRSYLAGRPPAPQGRYAAGHGLLALLIRRGHWCDVPIERLQHEARAALDQHPDIPGAVHVHIAGGVATLTGAVQWPGEQALAVETVKHVNGVRQVINRMTVAHAINPLGLEPPDSR